MANITHLTIVTTAFTIVIMLRLWQYYRTFDLLWVWKTAFKDIKTKIVLLVAIILIFTLVILIFVNTSKIAS